MSSESFHKQMDSRSSAILLLYSSQRLYTRGLTLIVVWLTLAAGEGHAAMFYLVMEACKSRATWAEAVDL